MRSSFVALVFRMLTIELFVSFILSLLIHLVVFFNRVLCHFIFDKLCIVWFFFHFSDSPDRRLFSLNRKVLFRWCVVHLHANDTNTRSTHMIFWGQQHEELVFDALATTMLVFKTQRTGEPRVKNSTSKTISAFATMLSQEIISVFRDVLLIRQFDVIDFFTLDFHASILRFVRAFAESQFIQLARVRTGLKSFQ